MKEYIRKNLNIKQLLTSGVLDIRETAVENETLSADEYFSKVEQFIENGSQLVELMSVISGSADTSQPEIAATDNMLRIVDTVKSALLEMYYLKLDTELDNLVQLIKTDDFSQSAALAGKIVIKLKALHEILKSAYTVKRFSSAASTDTADEEEAAILLSEALEYFDYLEENRKPRILAVDDITPVLNTVTSILRPYYEVFALKNSAQVENFLKQTRPELFLLDIEMGEVNGFELVPIIRRFEEHKDTPIIFLTGNASLDNLKDAVALGACDFITKPIDKSVLLEKIEKNIIKKKDY